MFRCEIVISIKAAAKKADSLCVGDAFMDKSMNLKILLLKYLEFACYTLTFFICSFKCLRRMRFARQFLTWRGSSSRRVMAPLRRPNRLARSCFILSPFFFGMSDAFVDILATQWSRSSIHLTHFLIFRDCFALFSTHRSCEPWYSDWGDWFQNRFHVEVFSLEGSLWLLISL